MLNKIKVCYIVSSLCNEGPVNVLYNIVRYIDFSRFEISIVTLVPEKEHSRIEDFQKYPISIHQLYKDKKHNLLTLYFPLRKKIQKLSPDIVHAHCPRSLYLISFLPKKIKKVYTIHIYPGLQQQILYGKVKGYLIIKLNNYFTRKIDMPVGCAESISTLYKDIQGWDIINVPNGCSLPVWKTDTNYKQKIIDKLGLNNKINYFIFIGRFSFEKHPEIIIEAFKKLNRKDIGLIMLGNGPLWSKCKEHESPNIYIPGFKTNIYEYLIASDYYISASDVEGLPNTLLESMTIGLPVILSDIPAHKEVLAKAKDCVGFTFDNKNEIDLLNRLQKLLPLNTEEVRLEMRRMFELYYTAEKMSNSYQSIYIKMFS